MSFILDALRKSEHERQRGAVPGIAQVPFATRQRETPRWALAAIGVLGVAVLGLGAAWWQSTRGPAEPAQSALTTRPIEVPPADPVPQPSARMTRVDAPPPAEPRVTERTPPAAAEAAPPPAADVSAAASVAPERSAPAEVAARTPAITARPETSNEPPLANAAALAAEGIAVPPLRLTLHGFSENPAERFVFINGARYREGETLREGPRVVSIERTGVVLSQQGRRFLLGTDR